MSCSWRKVKHLYKHTGCRRLISDPVNDIDSRFKYASGTTPSDELRKSVNHKQCVRVGGGVELITVHTRGHVQGTPPPHTPTPPCAVTRTCTHTWGFAQPYTTIVVMAQIEAMQGAGATIQIESGGSGVMFTLKGVSA